MIKNFKFVLVISILFIILFANITIVNAETKKASILISSNLPGNYTEQLNSMNYAKSIYDSLGYDTSVITAPSGFLVFSNALASNLLLYFCKGDKNSIEFDGGGLYVGDLVVNTPDNKQYYGTEMINWNDKKLVTLMASNTAGEGFIDSTSIASNISFLGAQMTVGWYTDVNAYSAPDWLDFYNDSLGNGGTPINAIEYANSKNYLYGNVKNAVVFSSFGVSGINLNTKIIQSKRNILTRLDKKSIDTKQIESTIKNVNPEFKLSDYEVTNLNGFYTYDIKTNNKEKQLSYIDYNLKIGDFITNSGYTVALNPNNEVIAIYDNTITLNNNVGNLNISEGEQEKLFSKAISLLDNPNPIIEKNIKFLYDLNRNKKQAYIEIKLDNGMPEGQIETVYIDI